MLFFTGSCDPYLEDNKLSAQYRVTRFSKAICEMLELATSAVIPADENVLAVRSAFRGVVKDQDGSSIPCSITFPEALEKQLRSFDVGGGGRHAELPLELLRNYMQKDDPDLTNSQLSGVLWSIARCKTDQELIHLEFATAGSSSEAAAEYNHLQQKNAKTDLKTFFNGETKKYGFYLF